ncbi:MAG: HAMP domain-containing histidine kinase [Pirellulales bacterium]|nr:HAMP domain-containing histidine kinase [Pirellulales bacterium]
MWLLSSVARSARTVLPTRDAGEILAEPEGSVEQGNRLFFPLSDSSAASLALAWLQPRESERIGLLLDLACRDASFCCWLASQVNLDHGSNSPVESASTSPVDRSSKTDFSLRDLIASVAGSSTLPLFFAQGSPRQLRKKWRRKAARQNALAVTFAELATKLAHKRNRKNKKSPTADYARLLALLLSGPKWLRITKQICQSSQSVTCVTASDVNPGMLRHSTTRSQLAKAYFAALPAKVAAATQFLSLKGIKSTAASPEEEWLPALESIAESHRHLQSEEQAPKRIRRLIASARQSGKQAQAVWKPVSGLPTGWVERMVFDSFCQSKTFQRSLEAEKLESLAEFAAGAGHEINNPIAVISGRASLLASSEAEPKRRRDLQIIKAQADRVYEMIAGMMFFARPPRAKLTEVDLPQLVSRLYDEIDEIAAARKIELASEGLWRPLPILADATQLAAALKAVYDNALFAVGSDGRIVTSISTTKDKDAAEITIRDTGPGISPEIRRHLFDPYFSGRQSGRGLGMGLSKAWRIIDQHAGNIDVHSESGHGATFVITLPLRQVERPAD